MAINGPLMAINGHLNGRRLNKNGHLNGGVMAVPLMANTCDVNV